MGTPSGGSFLLPRHPPDGGAPPYNLMYRGRPANFPPRGLCFLHKRGRLGRRDLVQNDASFRSGAEIFHKKARECKNIHVNLQKLFTIGKTPLEKGGIQ